MKGKAQVLQEGNADDDLVVGSISAELLMGMVFKKEDDEAGIGASGGGAVAAVSGEGRSVCPVCTFSNSASSSQCVMCTSPLRGIKSSATQDEDEMDADAMEEDIANTQSSGVTRGESGVLDDEDDEEKQLKLALEMSMRGIDEEEDSFASGKKRKRVDKDECRDKKEAKIETGVTSHNPIMDLIGRLFDFHLKEIGESFTDDTEIEIFIAKVQFLISLAMTDNMRVGRLVEKFISCLMASSEGLGKRSHELFQTEEVARLQILLKASTVLLAGFKKVVIENRAATGAVASPAEIEAAKAALKKSDKIDPKFVCGTHSIPAVRRRCSQGANVDRRFYVCGMPRAQRCDYWEWADGLGGGKQNAGGTKGVVKKVIIDFVAKDDGAFMAMAKMIEKHEEELLRLMHVMKQYEDGGEEGGWEEGGARKGDKEGTLSELMANKFVGNSAEIEWEGFELRRERGGRWEGCSKEGEVFGIGGETVVKKKKGKVGKWAVKAWMSPGANGMFNLRVGEEGEGVEIMMQLLRIVVEKEKGGGLRKKFGISWVQDLCRIVLKGKGSGVEGEGERAAGDGKGKGVGLVTAADGLLLALCGNKKSYSKVRDVYVFAMEVNKLRDYSQGLFDGGLRVWKRGEAERRTGGA